MSSLLQPWTIFVFKLIFATYLLLTVVVLINLLIAMMSDTYQRIQQQVISLADRLHYGAHKLCMNQSLVAQPRLVGYGAIFSILGLPLVIDCNLLV